MYWQYDFSFIQKHTEQASGSHQKLRKNNYTKARFVTVRPDIGMLLGYRVRYVCDKNKH